MTIVGSSKDLKGEGHIIMGGGVDEATIKTSEITCWSCEGYHKYEFIAGCGWSRSYKCPNCGNKINLRNGIDYGWSAVADIIKLLKGNDPVSTNKLRSILSHYEDQFERIWEHDDKVKRLNG